MLEKVPGGIFPATFEFSCKELFHPAVSFKNASIINSDMYLVSYEVRATVTGTILYFSENEPGN